MTLVTPNRRLAVYHKREFDLAQQRGGLSAWPTPDILSFPTFVERSWRLQSQTTAAKPARQLIDGMQSQLLWELVIRRSDAVLANALMNVSQTARQAASAWSILHAWHLLPAMQKFVLAPDPALFLEWARQYRALCREKELLDAAMLPGALADLLTGHPGLNSSLPMRILLAGFDIVTPQQHHLWRVLREAGVAVEDAEAVAASGLDDSRPVSLPARIEFANAADELRACAAWARQQVQNGKRRVAIVVPDLRGARSRITRELADSLMPVLRAQVDALGVARQAELSGLFNVSLGQPLGDYALVRDGIGLLALSQMRPMPFPAVSALLLSPHIAGAEKERDMRAMLDARLRERASNEISLTALQQRIGGDHGIRQTAAHCGVLVEAIAKVLDVNAASGVSGAATARGSRNKPPSAPYDWSRHFGALLIAWGFPGERSLDSLEFQVLDKFREALASLAALAMVQPRMRADEALQQLKRIVADTMFQPEGESNGQAPIQVLGILESAGQSFDALWVAGLSDDAWPLATRPNPFIPAALQRAAGVTEASALASLALDTRITQGWLRCAPQVIVSHSRSETASGGEQERAASALICDIATVPLSTIVEVGSQRGYAGALQSIGKREAIAEVAPSVLPSPTRVRGGAGVMRDQAACPFRAFARHRLGAKALDMPQAGPDALERGNLLHRALYLVWGRIEDHAGLANLDETGIARVVADAAAQSIAEARAGGIESLVGRFGEIEHARLCRILCEWLEYERERTPFTVVGREAARTATLAGLTMDLRLDRMDRLDDGTFALIDYKTGAARLASWLGARPDEPQLPVYFQTSDEAVSVLAFARVKRGPRPRVFGFEGLSAVDGLLPDVAPVEQKPQLQKLGYGSWDVMTQEWESTLNALATDFSRGCAAVDPKYGGLTCRQCDLQSLCRIAELGVARNEFAGTDVAGGLADIGDGVDDGDDGDG